ncbi:DNA/RNA polymerases superfamily protein [Gossypium australe]|uniref:DNA/RNA polymerases superfamily protein n=1 Tax=Gossypium australe TaxID=47621 RepID=A0A5B6WW06_9ROSI|nr:DNA/RNA polymerases superfamily protein [Gossypium australe]
MLSQAIIRFYWIRVTRKRQLSSHKKGFSVIGLEVYVDDILVKSGSMEEFVRSLSKTFAVLRAHKIKLNLEKCVFGVRAGRFFGLMTSKRWIEVNSKKIYVIIEMPLSRIIKGIQCFISKVVALNRFISKMVDKCLHFFNALRTSFSWSRECQAAFEELKLYLTSHRF